MEIDEYDFYDLGISLNISRIWRIYSDVRLSIVKILNDTGIYLKNL